VAAEVEEVSAAATRNPNNVFIPKDAASQPFHLLLACPRWRNGDLCDDNHYPNIFKLLILFYFILEVFISALQ
jgi:hypothetical protein